MTAEKVSLTIEASDSSRLQRQKKEVAKLREFKQLLVLKNEKAELEKEKMKACFYLSDSKYRKNITYKNKAYQVPKFTFIQEKLGKPQLRVLLVERSKKAEWLKLTQEQQKLPNWIDEIKIDDTEKQLNDGNTVLEKLLMENGLMVEMEPKKAEIGIKENNPQKTN